MRFYNYINEEYGGSYLNQIKKDCKPFLKDGKTRYNKNFLGTGKRKISNFIRNEVRRDRTPRDTPLEVHEYIDDWFKYEFGIRFRSNAVFCTLDMSIAEDYGNIYAIFPIGKYTTLSSPKVKDLWIDLLDSINNNRGNNLTKKEQDDGLYNLDEKLRKSNYKLNTFHYYNEIMIKCKEYYLLSYDVLEDMTKEDFII